MNTLTCLLCGKEIKISGFGAHLKKTHDWQFNSNVQEYYDRYLKKENEEKCIVCGNDTKFYTVTHGYKSTCSKKCAANDPKRLEKIKNTCLERYGVENGGGSLQALEKIKNTCLERYGVENPYQSEEKKLKIKSTCLERYGVEKPFSFGSDDFKNILLQKYGNEKYHNVEQMLKTKEQRGLIFPKDLQINGKTFGEYEIEVQKLTRKNKKKLYEEWNGCDFYDKEYIADNFNIHFLDKNYPSIDHKISISYGFLNKISAENLAHLDNLCITKRGINSQKAQRDWKEYYERLNE